MGRTSEAGISPLSPENRMDGLPEAPSQIRVGNPPNFEQDALRINTQTTQPQHQHPGLGQTPILRHQTSHMSGTDSSGSCWNRFAIPTKNDSLSSGFPFHPRLYELKVTHDQWHLFTSAIVDAAKLTPFEDYLAWTAGITTGTVSAPVLLIFGPMVGYYAGRSVHRKTVVKTVKERLLQQGDLRSILQRWNEQTFAPKGFQAWLELPRDPGELYKEYQIDDTLENKDRKARKAAKKATRRFRIVIIPSDDLMSTTIESVSAVPSSTISESVEAATGGYRTPQELHDRPSDPPAYSPSKEGQAQVESSASRSLADEVVELDDTDSLPVQNGFRHS